MIVYSYRKIKKHRALKAAEAEAAAAAPPVAPNETEAAPAARSHPISTTTSTSVTPSPKTTRRPCPQCATEKTATRKYRWKLLLCLLPGFFVASLDLTIVATALPQIASHFNKFNQLNWIVTAFTLTSTAFIPVFGQLADIFGRHSSLQSALILLTIGSVLCAVSPDWGVLLLGRALQGIGTAGISNVSMIVLADQVSLREQAINTSIFQLLNGIGYSVGPVIGGYLTNSNWRYCFVLGAGVSVISIGTVFLLRKDLKAGQVSLSRPTTGQTSLQALIAGLSTLDFGGIALFIFGIGLIILGTAWGGSTYPWSSTAVICPLVLGSVLFIGFVAWEYLLAPNRLLNRVLPRTRPMIPSSILGAKDVNLVCFIAAGTGAALYSVFYFIGIYFTLVEGFSSSRAGTQLLYYVPGIGVGVYAAIFVCNVWPRQTFFPLVVGTIVENAGIAALAYAVKARNATLVNVMMGIAGAGTGVRFMPSSLHLAGMFRDRLAPVYSMLRFALPFGGTLALTVMGSVFQNQMSEYFGSESVNSGNFNATTNGTSSGSGGGFNLHDQSSLDLISDLPKAQQDAIRSQGATATMWAFISIIPILGLSMLAALFLGNVWISKKKSSGDEADEAGEAVANEDGLCSRHAAAATATQGAAQAGPSPRPKEPPANEVEFVSGVYLLAMIRGNVSRLKQQGPREDGGGGASGVGAHLRQRLKGNEEHAVTIEK